MAQYRKKPVVIDAFEWTGDINQTDDPLWITEAIKKGKIWFNQHGTSGVTMEIATLEGNHIAQQGDYIIKGIKGEIYPCKPDIFEKTYEPV